MKSNIFKQLQFFFVNILGKLMENPVGTWRPGSGLSVVGPKYERRHLNGASLRITTVPLSGFIPSDGKVRGNNQH